MNVQTATTEHSPKTYNGWTNYETWAVNLWLTNDEGTYSEIAEITRKATRHLDEGEELQSDDKNALAQEMKEFVEGLQPDLGASL